MPEVFKFYHFWWLAPENSKNHSFSQKSLKNQKPDRCYEIESKVKHWFGIYVTQQAKL